MTVEKSIRRVWQCNGAIIVLDVLGWRGRESQLADRWQNVTDTIMSDMRDALFDYPQFHGINFITGVFETDSFVIGAWRDNREIDASLASFVAICANALFVDCWRKGLLLRGSFSFGEFTASSDNHMSGNALDDARSEASVMNWAGCHATLSTSLRLRELMLLDQSLRRAVAVIRNPPFKDNTLSGERCVLNWVYAFFRGQELSEIRSIMKRESESAISDSDKLKHEYTNRFFETMIRVYEARKREHEAKEH